MRSAIERDLTDAVNAVEHLFKLFPDMNLKERIDVCARLKGIDKSIESMDKDTKDDIKKALKHKEGSKLGEMFRAVLTLVPTTRLDQKSLKEDYPAIHTSYSKDATDERITFEPR